jgi:DNA-binding Xre family transcriptional regulator
MIKRNLIPELLEQKKLTIYKLAMKLTGRLSRNQVYKIAKSEVISEDTAIGSLSVIADALGVEITDLYERQENGDNG